MAAAASPTEVSPPPGFALARRIFAHGLGIVFFCAFASLAGQIRGLLGASGISPAAEYLGLVKEQIGANAYWELLSIFWLNSSDFFLQAVCWAGTALSLVLACGFLPGPCALLLWALYLSLNAVGSPFLEFQWDALLLEAALIAALYLPWHWRPDWTRPGRLVTVGRWLLWWLIGRLMFESGVVKLSSGDETWRNLTAMTYHYETQPLPLWTAWYAFHAPLWFHKMEVLATFTVEFLTPLGILAPRRVRHVCALAMIALQTIIAGTGNYTFFNLLTALLCVPLLDDGFWPATWRRRLLGGEGPFSETAQRTPIVWILEPLAGLSVLLTGVLFVNTFRSSFRWPTPIVKLEEWVEPLRSFNSYGLFAVMTTERMEIEVQGSNDGVNWQVYRFPYKPGDVRRRPKLVAPFQPRLDWQMWFAALGSYRQNPWFIRFLERLLEGSPDVLALLEWNPFPSEPPKYVRAVMYQYHFSDDWSGSAWWKREEKGLYAPAVHLRGPEDAEPPAEAGAAGVR